MYAIHTVHDLEVDVGRLLEVVVQRFLPRWEYSKTLVRCFMMWPGIDVALHVEVVFIGDVLAGVATSVCLMWLSMFWLHPVATNLTLSGAAVSLMSSAEVGEGRRQMTHLVLMMCRRCSAVRESMSTLP